MIEALAHEIDAVIVLYPKNDPFTEPDQDFEERWPMIYTDPENKILYIAPTYVTHLKERE